MWLIRYDNQRTCINANMQPCRNCTQQMALIVIARILYAIEPGCPATFKFGKTVRRNPIVPMTYYKNKWESIGLMDGYYVVGVIAIPYPRYGVIMNIVSKEDITYCITIGDIPHCMCPNFTKMSSQALGKKWKLVYCKHLQYVFRFLCKVNYESSFMYQHIRTMRLCAYLNLLVL